MNRVFGKSRQALMIALAASLWACSGAPFEPRGAGSGGATGAPAPSLIGDDLTTLELVELAVVETNSHAPAPSFDSDGRYLVFHASSHSPDHRGHRVSQVRALDTWTYEDRLIHSRDTESLEPSYDPYMGYGQPIVQTLYALPYLDPTYDPVFFQGSILASVTGDAAYHEGPQTQRFTMTSERSMVFGARGHRAKVAPDQSRAILHHADGLAEVDSSGRELHKYPGYDAVWAPSSDRFVAHLTPYMNPARISWHLDWSTSPEDPPPSSSLNQGGLFLARNGEVTLLTNEGGAPTWHPSGDHLIVEHLSAPPSRAEVQLAKIDVAEKSLVVLETAGRDPAYHPSGAWLAYQTPAGEIAGLSADGAVVSLGVTGSGPIFSPSGRYLAVLRPRVERRVDYGMDIVIYELRGRE